MPDPKGFLSDEEVDKVAKFLNALATGRKQDCPICGDENWSIVRQLVQPMTLNGTWQPDLGLPGYPSVMVVSMKCGYTRQINAVIAGIVPGQPEEKG